MVMSSKWLEICFRQEVTERLEKSPTHSTGSFQAMGVTSGGLLGDERDRVRGGRSSMEAKGEAMYKQKGF